MSRGVTPLVRRSEPPLAIDTMGVAIPCKSYDTTGCSASVTKLGEPGEGWRYLRKLPGGGFLATGASEKAWIEASLPKRVSGENVHGLRLGEALDAMRAAVAEAAGYAELTGPFEAAGLVRTDLVRDFEDVTHTSDLLDGLASVPIGGRMKRRRYQDAELNKAETLRTGPKAWGSLLYDKHAETSAAPEGQLRCETRLHRPQLESKFAADNGGVVRVIGDMTESGLATMRRAFFERVGYDREVAAMGTVAERVFTTEGLSPTEQATLWAYLTAPGFAGRLSRPRRYKYRDLAADLGVAPTTAHREAAETCPVRVRLDYDRGTEVTRVA